MRDTPEDDIPGLLGRACSGERESLERLLARLRPKLMTRIRLMMGEAARRTADSDDFLQGAFVDFVEALPRLELRDEAAFLRWATHVARNNIRDHVRKRREDALGSFISASGLFVNESEDSPSGDAILTERSELLIDALARLQEDHQQVIELRWFDTLPFAEVAHLTGRSIGAARVLHSRAMLRLGVELKRLGAD